ncbi:secreted immunoglobulin domain 1 [Trichomycterus rosablanca]|uniref:secreted immunoglobulin domain 1 n=1 Tax=Trichomycterus rosablanca TaxID=2290929 RepID=UPI002F3518E4
MIHKVNRLLFLCLTLNCISVNQGRNVTLTCPLKISASVGILSWYKQNAEEGPHILLTYILTSPSDVLYAEGIDTHRYVVLIKKQFKSRHRLQILAAEEKDTAIYYCGYSEKMDEIKKKP